ncbi:GDP-mannose 4,6-dehydratase [Candidatus Magnetominusculus xianensis]|uniref:GDP-mannose 4,6-dehydratase n=1 Tax=Candidatus Magnetominusculus xianensis TaxID=1748249 RepID=A0ABR5SCX6_9BACT|nr:GDP-mannose 4,6-dehydratase [Candidatus Magnetominusculus xianensis]KWT82519.1 GDP-mannose 4,6-dehydratase [Candidatus Magnetominusculus xianensis]MBF0405529.1 GDP-mannose 4,6-dehydratase [Nitrospirota bacterium]
MAKKTALITGILGQDGPYLARLLLDKGYRVYGLIRRYSNPNFSNTDYLGVTSGIEFVTGDITDEKSLMSIIKLITPDEVYNLAAQSFVGVSWEQPKTTTEVNSLGVLYLLHAIRSAAPGARLFQASTGDLFGNNSVGGIQNETVPFKPRSPYAVTKLYSYWMTVNFRESYGMFCANGILFNHESPIRGQEFVTRKISTGAAKIKLGLAAELILGNIDTRRDWGFAGDYVEAMWLMLQHERPDDYVIATGEVHSIREFLDTAFKRLGIDDWGGYVRYDSKFSRPTEVYTLLGSPEKAKKVLGWSPKLTFEAIVHMMVDADIARLSGC